MNIRILFDNRKQDKGYFAGWGVSYLIDGHILFDAGENEDMLFHNMRSMGVKPEEITKIVVSHEHWDHIGGLWRLLAHNPGMPAYICPGVSIEFKDKIASFGADITFVGPFMEIDRNVFTTGETMGITRYGMIPEQALVLRSEKGATVITGCAHNGIVDILASVREKMPEPIYLVLGGFHTLDLPPSVVRLMIKRFREMDVARVAPTHCTGTEAIQLFREAYGSDFVEAVVGTNLEV